MTIGTIRSWAQLTIRRRQFFLSVGKFWIEAPSDRMSFGFARDAHSIYAWEAWGARVRVVLVANPVRQLRRAIQKIEEESA